MTERTNQTIMKCLGFLVNTYHDNWDERLPTALYAYNTSPSFRSTDYTPYYILFGRRAKGLADLKLVIPEKVPSDIQDYVTTLVNNLEEAAGMADANICQHQIKRKSTLTNPLISTICRKVIKCILMSTLRQNTSHVNFGIRGVVGL